MSGGARRAAALNGICPYFTMFPLSFPLGVLAGGAEPGDVVLDPFCGRGTTNYASRALGLASFGVDSSPVAVALSQAKLANATPASIVAEAERILHDERPTATDVPAGEFWELAYHPAVLDVVCRLREGLLDDHGSDARRALRAVVLGALHGPRPKWQASYLSNQSQRTYAPKPGYAVRFWRGRGLRPTPVDVLAIIRTRAERYFGAERTRGRGAIALGDSRDPACLRALMGDRRARWVICSPPYYGLDTYFPDQWLRHWFVAGPASPSYASPGQIDHHSPRGYAAQLRSVWRNAAGVCAAGARLIVRFGGIRDRQARPLELITASLADSGWQLDAIRPAGSAQRGKRQAHHFNAVHSTAQAEYDLWARRA